MGDFDNLNSVLGAFDTGNTTTTATQQTAPATETQPEEVKADTTTTPDTTKQAEPSTEAKPDAAATEETDEAPETVFTGTKQNQAFAQMRVQNKQLSAAISKLGKIIGLPEMPLEQMLPLVEQRITEVEAKANNVPVELAQKLEELERAKAEQEAVALRTNADLAFQKVKDTYKLTQKQLVDFAHQLNADGKNPYAQPLDLLQEYRTYNFDAILAAERDQAVKDALARDTKAATKSTTPSTQSGAPSEPAKPITTMQQLDKLLEGMGK